MITGRHRSSTELGTSSRLGAGPAPTLHRLSRMSYLS
jgi:hypothetical protein